MHPVCHGLVLLQTFLADDSINLRKLRTVLWCVCVLQLMQVVLRSTTGDQEQCIYHIQ